MSNIPTSAGKNRKVKLAPKREMAPTQIAHQFKKGEKHGGRPVGSRNRFAEQFFKDFLADWEDHGASAIAECRDKDPATYVRVGASLLPKEFNINEGESALERMLEQYDIEELNQFIDGLTALGHEASRREKANQTTDGNITGSIH